jgi:hypothetical protein
LAEICTLVLACCVFGRTNPNIPGKTRGGWSK